MNWKQWLIGLANGAVSGVLSGGTAQFLGVGWKKALAIAGVSLLGSVGKWMAQHPMPGAPQ